MQIRLTSSGIKGAHYSELPHWTECRMRVNSTCGVANCDLIGALLFWIHFKRGALTRFLFFLKVKDLATPNYWIIRFGGCGQDYQFLQPHAN